LQNAREISNKQSCRSWKQWKYFILQKMAGGIVAARQNEPLPSIMVLAATASIAELFREIFLNSALITAAQQKEDRHLLRRQQMPVRDFYLICRT
jgi:hypothetical protein